MGSLWGAHFSKNSVSLERIEIFQFCFKIWHLAWHGPPMGCMGGWLGWWVGSGQITKNRIYLDLIKIFQFCLKIQHLWRLPHPQVGVWVVGWVDGWDQVKSLRIEYTLTLSRYFNSVWIFNICRGSPTHGCEYGWFGWLIGGVRSNH